MSLRRWRQRRLTDGAAARDRAAVRIAWAGWAISWVLLVLSVVLAVQVETVAFSLSFGAVLVAFATVGAVVAARQPHKAVGWLCLAVGLLGSVNALAIPYAEYAFVTRPGSLPGGLVMAWLSLWLSYVWALTATFLPLLFPTGRPPTPRWRPVARAAAVVIVAMCLVAATTPGPMDARQQWPHNPVGIEGAAAALRWAEEGLTLCLVAVLVLCAASVLVRFRGARGIERQQLKWFSYAIALFALLFVAFVVTTLLWGEWLSETASDVVFAIGYGLIPVSAGIAILRYRLYDIDRIINRSLVYGLLTALLGGSYIGVILLCGQLFGGITDDPPSWAVAGATLAVAALFQPARRRVQQLVDRRFNRRRYDAARTIDAFSVRLRDQVDLDTLTTELLMVIDQTVEPTTSSLWLRPQATPERGPILVRDPNPRGPWSARPAAPPETRPPSSRNSSPVIARPWPILSTAPRPGHGHQAPGVGRLRRCRGLARRLPGRPGTMTSTRYFENWARQAGWGLTPPVQCIASPAVVT